MPKNCGAAAFRLLAGQRALGLLSRDESVDDWSPPPPTTDANLNRNFKGLHRVYPLPLYDLELSCQGCESADEGRTTEDGR